MSIPFTILYPELGVAILLFFCIGLILWLVLRFQTILRVFISKIKGDLIKMDENKPTTKNIEIADSLMNRNEEKESKSKDRSVSRLPSSMLLMAFFMIGIALLIIINEMFDSIEQVHIIAVMVFTALMILCAFFIYCILYLERDEIRDREHTNEFQFNLERLKDISNHEILQEVRRANGDIERINRFLRGQYGDLYNK